MLIIVSQLLMSFGMSAISSSSGVKLSLPEEFLFLNKNLSY